MTEASRRTLLGLVIILIVGSIWYLESQKAGPAGGVEENIDIVFMDVAEKSSRYNEAVEIQNPSGFINTNEEEITIAELIGEKVILVDFWTYSCINCQRTLPYLNAWYDKYKDSGFEIVAVHTPEFAFEGEYANVLAAVEKYEIDYPVVLDNDYSTWRAYENRYWPRKYLIDIDGYIVYDHIGEGAYDETEAKIQELLEERASKLGEDITVSDDLVTPDAETPDSSMTRTPELYFGADRNDHVGGGVSGSLGTFTLTEPAMKLPDTAYLVGTWTIEREYAHSESNDARIILPYRSQGVYMVARSDEPISVSVLLDGKPLPENMYGQDVGPENSLTIHFDDLYRIIDADMWGSHTLELIIHDAGLDVYTFTFG